MNCNNYKKYKLIFCLIITIASFVFLLLINWKIGICVGCIWGCTQQFALEESLRINKTLEQTLKVVKDVLTYVERMNGERRK